MIKGGTGPYQHEGKGGSGVPRKTGKDSRKMKLKSIKCAWQNRPGKGKELEHTCRCESCLGSGKRNCQKPSVYS